MSALRLINETEITSSVASVSVTDIFTSDFDIYKIIFSGTDSDSINTYTYARFINSSGSIISASNYDFANLNMRAWTSFAEQRGTSTNYLKYLMYQDNQTADSGGLTMYVFNPTNTSSYTFSLSQATAQNSSNGAESMKSIGVLKQTNNINGIVFYAIDSSAVAKNWEQGIVRTYGLRVDS